MALFQKSVLTTFVQDESKVALRWAAYQKFLAKIDFIKTVKEEKYQDGFLKDIFEACLGYTLDSTNPSNFNLEREKKNETDGKKADGVIYVKGEVVGVVELKDQKTKQLDAIEAQAFNYHNSHSNSKYIIISNFDELRFYIDKKTAYEKFSLFTLSYDEFKKLHLLLSFESIKENIPQKLKEKSANFEQSISKELYKDFSIFRTQLFENIIENNPNIDKSLLLRLTQKLCDRIIFILFAEDRALLRHNTIKEIREEFANQRFTDYKLYDIFKFYFDGINTGNAKLNIPKYNGGLFATDEFLDSLKIDDVCLDANAQKLSNYDFVSDISVNILGHIFEQSLSDLEELNASINDLAFDKKNSKRKKDGVFYTPEYITRYIVENTLGKLCEEQKEALHVKSVEAPKNSKKPTKEEALTKENLERYKEWLLHVKILDPACGSGAFLNQALEYLIKEHKELQEKLAIMGDITAYYEIEASILENNLYGVDINEDAVEIARLSLWLRTAQKGRALANLSDKIKCANSLLEMPFEENSFDVVIGNPPYVRQEAIDNIIKEQYMQKFQNVATSTADLYVYFYELSINLLKENGILGFITPNKWMERKYGVNLRKYLKPYAIQKLVNFGELNIFEDASTEPAIIILENKKSDNELLYIMVKSLSEAQSMDYQFCAYSKDELADEIWKFTSPTVTAILAKFKNVDTTLKEYTNGGVFYGIKTGLNKAFIIQKETYQQIMIQDKSSSQILKKMVEGDDFGKWEINHSGRYMVATGYDTDIQKNYPAVFNYLEQFRDELIKRQDKGLNYWNLRACDYYDKLEEPKLIYYHTALNHKFYYDTEGYYISANCYFIANANKYLQCILNSKLFDFVKKYLFPAFGDAEKGGRVRLDANKMNTLPIKDISEEAQQPFIVHVDEILESKQKIKDYKILLDEAITCNNFDREIKLKKEIETLEKRVIECEQEIDTMVYKLYGLSEDEIKIVEGN
ncbi:Eco57I restriction-modification methylase domain-containing protein [Sulfurospirillum deleyianum]|uniref:site-specific DNA-methyltransferase (adenine-specific) n=1 Tax=Sulfurospirillum deleyianum (strain ATCC 51133 / DSM 6946 / 5175) TaxID=525898 RepID=D1B347_SULD5|nr:N-6 DNA methylase [Sulfurospirillum deleyianum]ACZ12517.1 protein of unknown function DUF450 [Sulfurospirillum deleyianum DSM 6946]